MKAQMKFVKVTKVANAHGLGKRGCLIDVRTSKVFPSFETPAGVQLHVLNVKSWLVIYTKAITFTFKNKIANKKTPG